LRLSVEKVRAKPWTAVAENFALEFEPAICRTALREACVYYNEYTRSNRDDRQS